MLQIEAHRRLISICIAQRRKKGPIKIKKPLKVPGITSFREPQ